MEGTTTVNRAERRKQRTRRRLLDAGRAVIAEAGVSGLTVGAVTERADLGRGSFYNHFERKGDLVRAVAVELIAEVAERAVVAPDDQEDPARHASLADQRFVSLAHDDPATARLVVELAADRELFGDAVRPFARTILEAGIAAGRFHVVDVDMALTVLESSALAVMRDVLAGTAPPDAARTHAATILTLFGLPPTEATTLTHPG